MNMKPIVAVAIALTVGIVTFSGVLIPAIESGVDTEDTFTNDGYYNMTRLDATSESVIVWDTATPNKITVDGNAIEITQLSTMRLTILGSDTICVRCIATQMQIIGSLNGTQKTHSLTANGASVMTITVSNGIVSSSVNDGEPKTFDLGNNAFVLAPNDVESDYVAVMKKGNVNAHVLGDSEIICCGVSISTNLNNAIGVFGKGNIEDGMTFSSFYTGSNYSGDTTISDVVINDTEIPSHKNLYSLENITMVINYNVDQTFDATYSYFIVPAEVTAEKSVHADASTILLFQTIPVFIVLGMIVAVVGVLYMKTRR